MSTTPTTTYLYDAANDIVVVNTPTQLPNGQVQFRTAVYTREFITSVAAIFPPLATVATPPSN